VKDPQSNGFQRESAVGRGQEDFYGMQSKKFAGKRTRSGKNTASFEYLVKKSHPKPPRWALLAQDLEKNVTSEDRTGGQNSY